MTAILPLPTLPLDDPALYFNRELSWLEFNRRVLEEANDPQVPLLERLKFLAIFGSNLDEFFMVRVGGLQQKVQAGISAAPVPIGCRRANSSTHRPDGPPARPGAYRCLHGEVVPALEREDILIRGERPHRQPTASIYATCSTARFSRPDAAGHRPRPSVSAPAQQIAEPGRDACNGRATRNNCSRWCRCRRCCRALSAAGREGASSSRRWKRSFVCICPNCFPAWNWKTLPCSA